MNLLVPSAALPGLAVPPVAITDGSADPVWVELPSRGGYVYGRRRTIRLPFDPATAEVARRWLRFDRRRRLVLTPLFLVLTAVLVASYLMADARAASVPLVLYGIGLLGQLWAARFEKRVTVAQHPEWIGRLGIYLPALPDTVATEWVRRNPAVQVVPRPPRWRRFPSVHYRWAAGLCAATAAAVWWFTLRDGEFGLIMLLAFVVLLGTAVVSAFRALPIGFIRFDDGRDAG